MFEAHADGQQRAKTHDGTLLANAANTTVATNVVNVVLPAATNDDAITNGQQPAVLANDSPVIVIDGAATVLVMVDVHVLKLVVLELVILATTV